MRKRVLKLTSLILAIVLISGTALSAFASPTVGNNNGVAFQGKYVKNFDESKYAGLTITYTEAGDPIIYDPDATSENAVLATRSVTATTKINTWVYQTSRLNTALFMIPKGKVVTVLQTNSTYQSTQIRYAGSTGWVYTSHLKLGS